MRTHSRRAWRAISAMVLAAALQVPVASRGEDSGFARFIDPGGRKMTPPTESITQVRFVTAPDFPPLNAIGAGGKPEGFNVEIAGAICRELGLIERCQIQALPFDEAADAVASGRAEAMIAGLSINADTRQRFAFTEPYLPLPGRFVTRREPKVEGPPDWNASRIGVMAGSAHERLLRDYFPKARLVTYSRFEWIAEDLANGAIDAAFGDGMREAIWLAGKDGQACCAFADGPYLAPEYLGFGLAIAVDKSRGDIVSAFDFALAEMEAKGVTAEIFRRHFPVSFF